MLTNSLVQSAAAVSFKFKIVCNIAYWSSKTDVQLA
jgi:hypothetical protein